jgi:hypothetical protein
MERRERWRQRVAQQGESGPSIRVFCRQKSLSEPAFYAWRKRLRSETKAVRFALVETKSAATASPIEVRLANGDRLRIPCEADPQLAAADAWPFFLRRRTGRAIDIFGVPTAPNRTRRKLKQLRRC